MWCKSRTIVPSTLAFCVLLSLVWSIGCSTGPEAADAVDLSDPLTGPQTITLRTPPSVPVLSPVLVASNALTVGAQAEVISPWVSVAMGNGGLSTEPDALLNDVWSRGPVTLGARVRVRGTLHAATLNMPIGSGATFTARDSNPTFDPPSTLSWTVTFPSPAAQPAVTVNSPNSLTLQPGQYGSVTANTGATLILRTGTYYLDGLHLQSNATLRLEQANGPVIVYVGGGTMDLRSNVVTVPSADPPDFLIVYFGTVDVPLEVLFNGFVIAPSASVTMRPVAGIHTGFFAGQNLRVVDAHSQVQYRAPLPILTAATPDGPSCLSLVQALVPANQVAAKLARYCRLCAAPDDTDQDGIADCVDGCPYDAKKTLPGSCGCGIADIDTDGDFVADCIDQCPRDARNTSFGECGCKGTGTLANEGTLCRDTACPQNNATCDGNGVCGDRASCSPAAGCKVLTGQSTTYWLCGAPLPPASAPDGGAKDGGSGGPGVTRTGAQDACSARGLTLARVDSLAEQRFLGSLLTTPVWLGANSITTANDWRWSLPNNNNGDAFWSGAANGAPVGSRFANWASGAPGSQRCAVIRPGDGRWVDTDCNQTLGYLCEFKVPVVRVNGGGGLPAPGMLGQPVPPMPQACISEQEAGLPATIAALQTTIQRAEAGVFEGAAANPPPEGTFCPEHTAAMGIGLNGDAGSGCTVTRAEMLPCIKDSDCGFLGSGWLCRQIKNNPSCTPRDGGLRADAGFTSGATCPTSSVCVLLSCTSAPGRCDTREVCGPIATVDAGGPDPGVKLDAGSFNPANLFQGGIPSGNPTAAYSDPPQNNGPNHTWCALNPQDRTSVKPAVQPAGRFGGRSGGSSVINFQFEPDLIFDANVNPLALGETKLHLHAQARLRTGVSMNNFLGTSFTATIVDAAAGLTVDRCNVNSVADTFLNVFGLDAVSLFDLGIPQIDSSNSGSPLRAASQACGQALDGFQLAADRAKKAFRDAQQLMSQYRAIKAAGGVMSGNLCQSIGVVAANVPFFPGGPTCAADEPVEVTINRFVDYYNAPGFGQISRLRRSALDLAKVSNDFKSALSTNLELKFLDIDEKQEGQTIVNAPFAIGPIPMVLQVDVFARYGIAGTFVLDLSFPFDLETRPGGDPKSIAQAAAHVMPYASAGLAAFVGAGVNLGAIKATVGIEGAVSLGKVKAPIFAGAGLLGQVTDDFRPLPADIASIASQFQFGIPKAFKFFVTYEYGAGLDLVDILSGEINARLRIKFFFFSRTWRKRVVKFNGWSLHFDLLRGGSDPTVSTENATVPTAPRMLGDGLDTQSTSTVVASGQAPMGRSEQQVPLMKLARLALPPNPTNPDAGTPPAGTAFDAGAVRGLFYDDLCCVKSGATCGKGPGGRPQCCPGFSCTGGSATSGTCTAECRTSHQDCTSASQCCSGLTCSALGICLELK